MDGFFNWQDKYDLKIDDMNNEHKILIKKMNKLHADCEANAPSIASSFKDMIDYTVKHFADEEQYMASVNYPGLGSHKLNHKNLLDRVTEYFDEYKSTGKISDKLFPFLKVWLSSHICGIDMKYSDHVQSM